MSEEMLVRHCSPTLAGVKTANLFTCEYDTETNLRRCIRELNGRLRPKGVKILLLRVSEKRALIYVYRPAKLKTDLEDTLAERLLAKEGYADAQPDRCIAELKRRLEARQDFPHEIGLFLGYPPEDVWGFMELGPDCSKCCGCWRVYGDEENARRLFAQYKKCTAVYCRRYQEGSTIERLTVAV